MRDELRDIMRLQHMVDAIGNVNRFMAGRGVDDLANDSMLFYAVVKNVEIVGEAAYKLSFGFVDSHPGTPWKQIIRMRHILVHGYYQIDPEQLHNVYTEDLPPLLGQLTSYISELSIDD